ncbi:MAG: phosphatase PAP2 family protein [Candidatus Eisenbacteria bacterium]|jgi:undecaprenyl-diphosphatase|nr:phosphatase PAP2 family protein [Candidatus Eisenbacteria bacterium]
MYGTALHLMHRWDLSGSQFAFRVAERRLIADVMKAASALGDGHSYAVAAGLLACQDPSTLRTVIPAGLIAFALELLVQTAVKAIVRRPRPFRRSAVILARVRPPGDFSFPSGHAAGAFVFASLAASVHPSAAAPCYSLAALVAVSRVANGVHYPSDVIAGAILGMVSAGIGVRLVR